MAIGHTRNIKKSKNSKEKESRNQLFLLIFTLQLPNNNNQPEYHTTINTVKQGSTVFITLLRNSYLALYKVSNLIYILKYIYLGLI